MADHASAFYFSANQEAVTVAVGMNRNHSQPVSGSLALGPQLVAGTAEECHISILARAFECKLVHKAQHQDLSRVRILNDGGDKALHLFKVDIGIHSFCFRHKK